ncbi:MAG: GNAT family N-acetyltransferase [Dehalococcoidales bacterium]|nr:MAG: GNAT family N-acetyltransferase [Dehalococcoidales bacterium]
MSVEFRPATKEEMERFHYVAGNALVFTQNPDTANTMQPELTYCAFEDGKLATTYAEWPLMMRFNGSSAPIAGVTFVGTLPIYRRRGYLRKITTSRFEILREQGERVIAALYASRAAIYQRYGYAVVSTQNSYNFDPRYLQFSVPQAVPGAFRELADDEFPLLVELYRHFRADKTGYIHRPRAMWDSGVLVPPPTGGMLTKVVYQEGDKPLGHLIYVMESPPGGEAPGPNARLTIRDLVWLTPAAYRAAWDYIANMDLVSNVAWYRVPSDDPLSHLLLEPRMLRKTSGDGLLGRIIDVEKALPQRQYDEEGTLTFEISDELCPWNQGRWKLEASTEGSSVSRTKEDPQVTMPVSTLAMLMFGQISTSEAAWMARLDVGDSSALPLWDKVMRTKYRPFCADGF